MLKEKSKIRLLIIPVALVLIMLMGTTAFAARTLSITQVVQAKTNWCWAACSEMVGRYQNSNSTRDQWAVVKEVKGSSYPNDGGTTSEIQQGIRYASVNTVTYTNSSTLTFAKHESHIDNSDPLVVWMSWNSGNAHVVVCAGYKTSGSTDYLYLIDPIEDTTKEYYNYTSLKNGTSIQSGTGKYTTTIYKK